MAVSHPPESIGEQPHGGEPDNLRSLLRPTEAEIATARRRLQLKAAVIIATLMLSYWAVVFADIRLIGRLACAVVLVIAMAAMGTGIMHDANHGAFSRSRRVNRVLGCTLDLLGGSSRLWRVGHNTLHHASTNVVGVDTDIDQAPFARLAPQQRWHRWHRFQYLYMWLLYGLVALRWLLFVDFLALVHNRVGVKQLTGRRSRLVTGVVAGKVVHLSWAVLIPLTVHPWWAVLAFYLACSWCIGSTLAVVFQLAHCVEEAAVVGADADHRGPHFTEHQLETTVNVRCGVPVLRHAVRFLMGGLDHQIEHHLAPGLPHTIYPLLARRLAGECQRRQLPYLCHVSLTAALGSHGRWLKRMGRPPGGLVG